MLSLTTGGAIATIAIERPQTRNAMTLAMWDELHDLARGLALRRDIRVVVIRGTAEAFVSGADINELQRFLGAADGIAYEARVDRALCALEAIAKPVVAVLEGICTGGGCILAAACDWRVGGPDLRVGIPVARTLGNCLTAKNAARIVALTGVQKLKELIFSAELVSGETAHRIGFLSELAAPGEPVRERGDVRAAQLAELAPRTLAATKALALRLRESARLPDDSDLVASCYGSEDFREGIAAFLGKRRAVWRDR